jgi:hypothetical protein
MSKIEIEELDETEAEINEMSWNNYNVMYIKPKPKIQIKKRSAKDDKNRNKNQRMDVNDFFNNQNIEHINDYDNKLSLYYSKNHENKPKSYQSTFSSASSSSLFSNSHSKSILSSVSSSSSNSLLTMLENIASELITENTASSIPADSNTASSSVLSSASQEQYLDYLSVLSRDCICNKLFKQLVGIFYVFIKTNEPFETYTQGIIEIQWRYHDYPMDGITRLPYKSKQELLLVPEILQFVPLQFRNICIEELGNIAFVLKHAHDAAQFKILLNSNSIQYHEQAIAYISKTIDPNPSISKRFSVFTAISNFRFVCIKASIILMCRFIIKNPQELGIINNGIKYALFNKLKTEKNGLDPEIRFILDLATLYNAVFPLDKFPCFPTHYLPQELIHFSYIGEFGEYYPYTPESFLESHLSVTARIEDENIAAFENCVFYTPFEINVKKLTRKYVADAVNILKKATNMLQIIYGLTYVYKYEEQFVDNQPKQSLDISFTNEEINQLIAGISDDIKTKMHNYFGGGFSLYATIKLDGNIGNTLLGKY